MLTLQTMERELFEIDRDELAFEREGGEFLQDRSVSTCHIMSVSLVCWERTSCF